VNITFDNGWRLECGHQLGCYVEGHCALCEVERLKAALRPFAEMDPTIGQRECRYCAYSPAWGHPDRVKKPEYHFPTCPWRTAHEVLLQPTAAQPTQEQGQL